MAFIDWANLDLMTGHAIIDEQHQKIIEIVNGLYEEFLRIRDNSSAEEFKRHFYATREYINFHFEEEEKIMSALSYLYMADHVKTHREFQAEMDKLTLKLNDHRNPNIKYVSKKLLLILRDLLLDHITDDDKVFVRDCAHILQKSINVG